MKFLASLAIMAIAFNATANVPTEETVFGILKRNGVYVQYMSTTNNRTGTLELKGIVCSRYERSTQTNCYFTDTARPLEQGYLEGNDAFEMYDAIVLSGAKTTRLFGETYTALSVLHCEENILNGNGLSTTHCQTLKPMLN